MPNSRSHLITALVSAAAVIAAIALTRVHAEPQPAFDRGLVERFVRAQEAQVRAQEAQVRSQEAQVRALDALVRAAERCNR